MDVVMGVTAAQVCATQCHLLCPLRAYFLCHGTLALFSLQFALGIWTLLEYVPVHLGSAHQANAMNLFTAVLVTLHTLRPPQPGAVSRAIARFGAPLVVCAVAAVGVAVTVNN